MSLQNAVFGMSAWNESLKKLYALERMRVFQLFPDS